MELPEGAAIKHLRSIFYTVGCLSYSFKKIFINAALSGARRASTPVPCSPRSGAEGGINR